MELQLYMWTGSRQALLERHDFYIEQIKKRILSQFRDIEGETDRYADEEYERFGSTQGEDSDMGEAAEWATDRGHSFYSLLSDLKTQAMLSALAGMYHLWDKDLRDFIERELVHDIRRDAAAKTAWNQSGGSTITLLKDFGWDCQASRWYQLINACRLVVNVYKHGKGPSLQDLAKSHPIYLRNSLPESVADLMINSAYVDYEWLSISESQFDEFAAAFREFWVDFPERLYLIIK